MSLVQSRERDGTISMRVAGSVAQDPKVYDKMAVFSVRYKKGCFLNVKVWNDSPCGQLARCLEKGDHVAVDGIFETYTGKDGKAYSQIVADFITVQPLPPPGDEPKDGAKPADGGAADAFTEEEDDGELPF